MQSVGVAGSFLRCECAFVRVYKGSCLLEMVSTNLKVFDV